MSLNRQNLIAATNKKIGLSGKNAELAKALLESPNLATNGRFEKDLDELRIYKNTTATLGALSPQKAFIFGIPLNTVPRRKRAIEARKLRDLFKAARLYVSGQATQKDEDRLNKFLAQIKQTAKDTLDNMVKRANNPEALSKPTAEQTAKQVAFNRDHVDTMTLDEMAGVLTVINYTTPKHFNSETIDKMRKGTWANLDSIDNLHKYVAEQLVEIPSISFSGGRKPDVYSDIAKRCTDLLETQVNANAVSKIASLS